MAIRPPHLHPCTWRGSAISADGWRVATDTPAASSTNTFPTPPGDADLSKLEPLAQAVLDARSAHHESTLADLYDPDIMPPDLRRAHQALDRAVDRLYRRTGFASERERVEHLFALYEKMRAPLEARVKKKPRRRRG